jgi:hypothetical protein
MSHTPIFLRDLKPEFAQEYQEEIQNDPKLKKAFDNGEDIIVGWYKTKPEVY